ncbi:MAG: hypothetical protein QOC80_2693, partial [Frankiaceae bacterium]|nr:hypothetical protein [Frankiaceae bacterium]
LMRRVADTIEEAQRVGDIEVHEIVFAIETAADGDYPHFKVYFTMADETTPDETTPDEQP